MVFTLALGIASAQDASFDLTGAWTTNGAAAMLPSAFGNALRVTPASVDVEGSAYRASSFVIPTDGMFRAWFEAQLDEANVGGGGLTFVMQGQGTGALGNGGGGMGWVGISPGWAVEIDVFESQAQFGDPDDNHVGIDVSGDSDSLVTHSPAFSLDGQPVFVWVEYRQSQARWTCS